MSEEKTVQGEAGGRISAADWETIATGKVLSGYPPLILRDGRSVDLGKIIVRDRRNAIKSPLSSAPA